MLSVSNVESFENDILRSPAFIICSNKIWDSSMFVCNKSKSIEGTANVKCFSSEVVHFAAEVTACTVKSLQLKSVLYCHSGGFHREAFVNLL